MAELRKLECQICGGPLIKTNDDCYECTHCHSKFEIDLTKVSDELLINLNRAASNRRKAKFDEAAEDYEAILEDNPDNFDAAWGLMLANKHITHIKNGEDVQPILYDAGAQSIFDNAYYKKAMSICPFPDEYVRKAMQLDALRGKAYQQLKKDNTDILICCIDKQGRYTDEINLAQTLVKVLGLRTKKNVFWTGTNLANVNRSDYEPYLYAAIKKAKVLIVLTSSLENCCDPQLESIWKRFIRFAKEESDKNVFLALAGCDVDDMPKELKKVKTFDVQDGNFNALLDTVQKLFETPKKEEKKAKASVEEKTTNSTKSQPKETKSSNTTTKRSIPSGAESFDNSKVSMTTTFDNVGRKLSDGDISTNPQALRSLASKIRSYGLGQQNIIRECHSALSRLTYSWDDSHMVQILDEIARIQSRYDNKMYDINAFADWLDQKATVLDKKNNIK
ncbi:MAG: tetratricopeptide repeat protein [Christensenellales bacterium]